MQKIRFGNLEEIEHNYFKGESISLLIPVIKKMKKTQIWNNRTFWSKTIFKLSSTKISSCKSKKYCIPPNISNKYVALKLAKFVRSIFRYFVFKALCVSSQVREIRVKTNQVRYSTLWIFIVCNDNQEPTWKPPWLIVLH